MKALVTGGGGFLGSAIVRLLRDRGYHVRSFSRQRHPQLNPLAVEQVQGDLTNQSSVIQAMKGCDIVYHVAAKAGVWGRYGDFYQTNVLGTETVISACRKVGIQKLVYTSSPSVVHSGGDIEGVDENIPYPKHFEASYPETKAFAERMVLRANDENLATVALRPHLIWGPNDPHLIPRILDRARKGKLRQIGKEVKLVDTVYVDNAAGAHVLAGEKLSPNGPIGGKAYFITNDDPQPLWPFINRILEVAGLPPVTDSVPYWLAHIAGTMMEWTYRLCFIPWEPPMTRFVARQLSTAHWYDISAAKRDLGYSPKVSIDEGLRRLGEWLRDSQTQ